jgi:putative flippase GtrA
MTSWLVGKISVQFLKYCMIGVSGVVVDFLLYCLMVQILNWDYQLANFISASAGIANNYWWNRKWTFQSKDHPWARFMRFYSVGVFGLGLSAGLLYLLIEQAGLGEVWAKVICLMIVVLFQYNLNKRYSFGNISFR